MTFDCSTLSGFEEAHCEALLAEATFWIYLLDFIHFATVLLLTFFILYFFVYRWVFKLR